MGSIPLILFSLFIVYFIRLFLRFRATVQEIGNHPGRWWFLSEASLISNAIPRIKWFSSGTGWGMVDKHEPFSKIGWDVLASTSIFPLENVLNVAEATLIKEITSDRARFPKHLEQYDPIKFFGSNIIVSEGELWKKYKKISYPAFSDRNNKLVWEETIHVLSELFDDVWGDRDSVIVDDCLHITYPLVRLVLTSAGFGKRLSWHESDVVPQGYKTSFNQSVQIVTGDYAIKILVPRWALHLTEKFRYVRDGFDDLSNYIKDMIKERQNTEMSGKDDLFSNLLKANNSDDASDGKLDTEELVSNIYMFLVAGMESSGHTLCFALALLAVYTEEQEKLYDHIRSVLPEGRIPTYEEMPLFTYTLAVFYETLRLFPPVPRIPKVADKDARLTSTNGNGETRIIPVPKGTIVNLFVAGLHYNPRYWEDPHSFRPERFLADWPRDAFLPFSGGARACIGRKFAETEAVAALTLFVSKFKIRVKEEPQFSHETFEQRRERVLRCTESLTTKPVRVSLVFTRRR